MKHFSKTTFVGGVLFLVPVVLVLWVLNHALQLTAKVSRPISKTLHLDQLGEWSGIGAATVIAVLVLVLVSFAAGAVARTNAGKRVTRSLEDSLLGGLPQYQLIKSMAEGLAQIESASGVKPVLVSVDDGWQIGYLLEPLGNGWVAVFLPQAPTPMSGNVMYLRSDRIRPLQISMIQAMSVVKRIGVGSGDLLRNVDLSLPKTL
jgi:uncharacterized membrane protein